MMSVFIRTKLQRRVGKLLIVAILGSFTLYCLLYESSSLKALSTRKTFFSNRRKMMKQRHSAENGHGLVVDEKKRITSMIVMRRNLMKSAEYLRNFQKNLTVLNEMQLHELLLKDCSTRIDNYQIDVEGVKLFINEYKIYQAEVYIKLFANPFLKQKTPPTLTPYKVYVYVLIWMICLVYKHQYNSIVLIQ